MILIDSRRVYYLRMERKAKCLERFPPSTTWWLVYMFLKWWEEEIKMIWWDAHVLRFTPQEYLCVHVSECVCVDNRMFGELPWTKEWYSQLYICAIRRTVHGPETWTSSGSFSASVFSTSSRLTAQTCLLTTSQREPFHVKFKGALLPGRNQSQPS